MLGTQVRKNSEKSIGGLLSFNPSTMGVTQLLEGPAAAVRELFTAIMVDSRHTDCRLSKEELLLSEDDYLFGAAWGMMQSETQETGLVDLPSRIWQAYHAQTASAALEQVDDPLRAGRGADDTRGRLHDVTSGLGTRGAGPPNAA